jgi:hypothetical protein
VTFSPEDIALLRSSSVHSVLCSIFDEENPSTRECNCDGFITAVRLAGQMEEANRYLNTPEYEDFAAGVVSEARHQLTIREMDDKLKTPGDWFWTLGYLAGKALWSATNRDWTKTKHHLITSAALLNNWHRAILALEEEGV